MVNSVRITNITDLGRLFIFAVMKNKQNIKNNANAGSRGESILELISGAGRVKR